MFKEKEIRKMENKNKLFAAITAMIMLVGMSGCGYIEDLPAEDEDMNISSSQEEPADESQDEDASENDSEPVDESSEEPVESTADSSEESSSQESTSSAEPGAAGVEMSGDSYTNSEFGFTMKLPEGTEYYDIEDVLKPAFDNESVEFRALMETKSTDSFNMAVQLYSTTLTLDDFAKLRWEYADNINNSDYGDKVEVLDTSNAEVGGKPAQLITEVLTGENGTFYTVRLYSQISDSEFIFIQGNCYDEATLETLVSCAQSLSFSE